MTTPTSPDATNATDAMDATDEEILADDRPRCLWASGDDALMRRYHDEEWGVPEWDSRALFEKLLLDGAQAGLSWKTILHRRDGYRRAFDRFDPVAIAAYGEDDVARLLADPGIIRNRQKVRSAIGNARAYLELEEQVGSFSDYLWSWVNGSPLVNHFPDHTHLPAQTELSRRLSKDLQDRGFSFVGPTIVYAFMQAVGMVMDHTVRCFRSEELVRETSVDR